MHFARRAERMLTAYRVIGRLRALAVVALGITVLWLFSAAHGHRALPPRETGHFLAAIAVEVVVAALLTGVRNAVKGSYDYAFDVAQKTNTAAGISSAWNAEEAALLRMKGEK